MKCIIWRNGPRICRRVHSFALSCLRAAWHRLEPRTGAEKGNRGLEPKQFGGSKPRFLEANVSGTEEEPNRTEHYSAPILINSMKRSRLPCALFKVYYFCQFFVILSTVGLGSSQCEASAASLRPFRDPSVSRSALLFYADTRARPVRRCFRKVDFWLGSVKNCSYIHN